MGVIICNQHGRQQIVFVVESLRESMSIGKVAKVIYRIEIDYGEEIIYVFFTDKLNEKGVDENALIVELEKKGEEAIPICRLCFRECVESNAVDIRVKKIVSTSTSK